ncbi:Alpha/Beta hydrolase protein [Desarmillaria tabescens]|uniref:Alpha/Beta hydrolase protein n=1 Tax=Armillaria tabescens TaxID=1929756 RepID=A0AA39N694_ARMTA|nr:Alpha/Beta hydrolase protein [Desarmillaria tabescens]KAK0459631.1 Alpha/Beta hydrolase protein [Desarmillaria tabescens]
MGGDPFRQFDLYFSRSNGGPFPLICFIHGGAWRSEDKSDHSVLAERLVAFTGFPVIIPNYRLTPKESTENSRFQHPGHAEDVLQLLDFLMSWEGPTTVGHVYDPHNIYIMGHSCGAHMLASIFLDSSFITPTITPSPQILNSVHCIIMSEGIYDIDTLITRFPSYRTWFIEAAFGGKPSYSDYSVTHLTLRTKSIRWFVIHSKGDSLVDTAQSEIMYQHLHELYGTSAGFVTMDVDRLHADHNAILEGDAFVELVGQYILKDRSSTSLNKTI